MKHGKRREMGVRLTALGLAAALVVGGANALHRPVHAGQSAGSFVEEKNLNTIFAIRTTTAGVGLVDGNWVRLADEDHWVDGVSSTALFSKGKISLKANWKLEANFTIVGSGHCHYGEVALYGSTTNYRFSAGRVGGIERLTVVHGNDYEQPQQPLTEADFGEDKPYCLSFDAAANAFTLSYNGKSITYLNPFTEDVVAVQIRGLMDYKGDVPAVGRVEGTFLGMAYTDYSPTFLETKLLDESGQAIPAGTPIADGSIVTVQAKIKNNWENGGTVPSRLKLSDSKEYPTAGLHFDPAAWGDGKSQKITVNGVDVTAQGDNVATGGIPFDCSPAETVITYRAKVANPEGKTVTIGQMMVDDFFQSKQYSGDELIPAKPLVPYDPEKPAEEQGTAGKDYHYTRTPANENGWNAGPVEITFYPDQFNQFLIKEGEAVTATLDQGNRKTSYSQETGGTQTTYQAKHTETGELSTTVEDAVKIDATAPTLSASGKALTLSDSLSGIWKVERYDVKAGRWVGAKAFSLTDGNGAASQTFTASQNGKYRAVDAAGNASPALAVTVNDPPSADPSDPDVNPSDSEKATDENGLVHTSIRDSMQEVIDREAPLYGGRFTAEDAKDLFDGRYGFSSNVPESNDLTYAYTIAQGGKDVTGEGVDTTQPGAFTVTCVVTDAEGNTTTVVLTDTLIDRSAPPTVDWGEDPDPPVGPSFDPLKPLPKPTVKDDPATGKKHAHLYDSITEVVGTSPAYGGKLTTQVAAEILKGRYQFGSAQGDGVLTYGPVTVTVEGKEVPLGTAKPGSCVISQTVTDSQGNQTTVHLTYTFVDQGAPPVVEYDPSDPTVEPGSRPDAPEVVEDWQNGTKYATVKDRLVQVVSDPPLSGGWLDEGEIRDLIAGRYRFTSAQPDGALKEIRFAVTQNGKAVEGIDTTQPGEYVIAYTLEDSSGNRTSLFLQYRLAEKTAGGSIEGETAAPGGGQPNTGDVGTGLLGGGMGRETGSCGIHWGLLALAVLVAGYTLFRKGQLDREEGRDRETL
ncbi:hypothetical protein SAMN05444424_2170 [Bittarella massiliensis (ex Durand et al. 2017)]|uniref:Uncharacterized protein n=2 Tax=Eubacteriales TaxID=186802 RepID=A0AAQ1MEF3_9FIRM|nr:hypothetical protein [Bittarella massiliensis (ex Durand et al. 2017)]SHG34047.1 hypothetical protein SAMN05444424_2170 [Bittarella massiliensis (ex Durand et al. 2017)]